MTNNTQISTKYVNMLTYGGLAGQKPVKHSNTKLDLHSFSPAVHFKQAPQNNETGKGFKDTLHKVSDAVSQFPGMFRYFPG